MITIDILSPVGGRTGGIENVIRAWTRKLPATRKVRKKASNR